MQNPVFACVNSASFDYFIAETLLPLTNGFTTVVFDDAESTIQEQFLSVVAKNNVNVIMTTPIAMIMIIIIIITLNQFVLKKIFNFQNQMKIPLMTIITTLK